MCSSTLNMCCIVSSHVLQCVAVLRMCCSVLQCVAVICIAACCSHMCFQHTVYRVMCCSVLQFYVRVAVVVICVAACCLHGELRAGVHCRNWRDPYTCNSLNSYDLFACDRESSRIQTALWIHRVTYASSPLPYFRWKPSLQFCVYTIIRYSILNTPL